MVTTQVDFSLQIALERNVPHLACKVWVRGLFSLKRWGCVKYRINTYLFLSTQPMSTNFLLTPCSKVRYIHVAPLVLAMSTNSVLTPCEQGAVHFSPRPYAQYRWATRLQARCGTLPCNHLSSYSEMLNPIFFARKLLISFIFSAAKNSLHRQSAHR